MRFRKFLYKSPEFTDVVSWSIDTWKGIDPAVEMNIDLSNGRREYSLYLYKSANQSVAKALTPINELIDALSKAAIQFAKSCNEAQAKQELNDSGKVSSPGKKAKKSEPSKK